MHKYNSNKKFLIITAVTLFIVLLLSLYGVYHFIYMQKSYKSILSDAFKNSYSIEKYKKTENFGLNKDWLVSEIDLSVNSDPLMSNNYTVRRHKDTVSVQTSTSNNSIVHYVTAGAINDDLPIAQALNKGIPIVENGVENAAWYKAPKINNGTKIEEMDFGSSLFDTRDALLGINIVGNFDDSQQKEILSDIDKYSIYSFNEDDVKIVNIGGNDCYRYHVLINQEKMHDLLKKVASYYGLSQDLFKKFYYVSSDIPKEAILYVDTDELLVKKVIEIEDFGYKQIYYSDYNTAAIKGRLSPATTYESFSESINAVCREQDVENSSFGKDLESSVCLTLKSTINE